MLHRVFRHVRILWRVEATIAEARLHLTVRRAVLYALAGLIAVFGLGMLNVAAFFAFASQWGPIWAAVFAAGGDFVVAIAIAGLALAARPGPAVNHALELRQAALDGLDDELAGLREPFAWLTRNPIDAALPTVMIPLLTAIIRSLRKIRASPTPPSRTE